MSEELAVPTTSGDDVTVVTGAESEPLRGRALYTSIAGALVGAVVSFGLPLSADQAGAVAILIALVAPQVVQLWSRRHVNSPATMRKVLADRGVS